MRPNLPSIRIELRRSSLATRPALLLDRSASMHAVLQDEEARRPAPLHAGHPTAQACAAGGPGAGKALPAHTLRLPRRPAGAGSATADGTLGELSSRCNVMGHLVAPSRLVRFRRDQPIISPWACRPGVHAVGLGERPTRAPSIALWPPLPIRPEQARLDLPLPHHVIAS